MKDSLTGMAIDRQSLVTRHRLEWNDPAGLIPLGNGEFCFNADGTGLQTFGGNSMSHWGWHSFPLPPGWTPDRVPVTGTFQQGRCRGPDECPPGAEAIWSWMCDNPHILNLGRLRLVRADGSLFSPADLSGLSRTLDLWSGIHTTSYHLDGAPVRIITGVHPDLDAVAIRIESPLVENGALQIAIDFPYPSLKNNGWVGDFAREDAHTTTLLPRGARRADLARVVDGTTCQVSLKWTHGHLTRTESTHRYLLTANGTQRLELFCLFSREAPPRDLPSVGETLDSTALHWNCFWSTGGAIDLSGSRDPRWHELERRIVLSQYLMAAQSAGSWPSSEAGLMEIDPWHGQFHMEMVWWHLAHYALWDRWPMAEQVLGCYRRFAPGALALAEQLGYRGLKWQKAVGPEGRTAPWRGNQVLLWKQPHPIFFAELEYRLRPTQTTLGKWAELVEGTAEHMADYATLDPGTGRYSLDPAMPPSELGITRDPVFDLAYWRWGLDKAQEWRERLGLPRVPQWDEVRRNLSPLPVAEGVFVHSPEWTDTYSTRAWEHPDPVGVCGMLPPVEEVDPDIARRTVRRVWDTWNWDRCWGWDTPWIAMAAARTGQPELAVEALLKDSRRNHYDVRGVNTGGPCPYLPGNGGLLYAVAMMVAGWDGCPDLSVPGFPRDGSWSVKWEGLRRAP